MTDKKKLYLIALDPEVYAWLVDDAVGGSIADSIRGLIEAAWNEGLLLPNSKRPSDYVGVDPAAPGADLTVYTPIPNSLLHPSVWDCPVCREGFGSFEACQQHLLKVHGILDDPDKEGKP